RAAEQANREAIRAGGYFPRTDENAFGSQERHLLVQELAGLQTLARQDSLVLYLNAFASRGGDGLTAVWPADFNPDAAQTRLPLRDVLRALAGCPAPHKLLVLDIMRPAVGARLGELEPDAASAAYDEIQRELAARPDPARLGLILCACAPGEVSLASETLGRSIFNYYFEEGLRGWADGYNARNERNGRISVTELAEFVRAHVGRWAAANRGTPQTPLLLGTGPDFALRALPQGRPEPRLALPDPGNYPSWLLAAWKLRDAWVADGTGGLDPRLLLQFQATVL